MCVDFMGVKQKMYSAYASLTRALCLNSAELRIWWLQEMTNLSWKRFAACRRVIYAIKFNYTRLAVKAFQLHLRMGLCEVAALFGAGAPKLDNRELTSRILNYSKSL